MVVACSSSDDTPATTPSGTDASVGDASTTTEDGSALTDASTGTDGGPPQGRPYKTVVPTGYDKAKPAPLVILLHGYSASSTVQEAYFHLGAVANAETFLYAIPDGTVDGMGNQFWNASASCCNFYGSTVDDIGYIAGIIDDMSARYSVDPKRIYVVGHSNGGFMAHRMACELSGRIAAIVSLAGTMDAANFTCKADHPVSILHVHGTADTTIAYAGGSVANGAPAFLGAKDTVAVWAGKNGCTGPLTDAGETLDLDTKLAGSETKVERYTCTTGAVELWSIQGGAHVPSFGTTWGSLIYGFLKAHPKG